MRTHVFGADDTAANVAVVLLHGRDQTPEYMAEVAGRIAAPGARYHAPASPGGSWYPESFLAPYAVNRAGLEAALGAVDAEVQALEAGGWARDRIAFVGFSQGACVASEYAYRNPARWAGLVAFTGGLVGPAGHVWAPAGDLEATPVLLTNGDQDPWVPWWRAVETAERFRQANAEVDLQLFPGREHIVSDEECALARALLEQAGRGDFRGPLGATAPQRSAYGG